METAGLAPMPGGLAGFAGMAGFEDGGGGGGRRAPFVVVVVAVEAVEATDEDRTIGGGVDAAGGPVLLKFFCLLRAAMRSASVENWGSSTSVMVAVVCGKW